MPRRWFLWAASLAVALFAAVGTPAANGVLDTVIGASTGALAQHRFWRITFNGNQGATGGSAATGVGRIEAYAKFGGDNIMPLATITSSTASSGSFLIANATGETYTGEYLSAVGNTTPSVFMDFGAGHSSALIRVLLFSPNDQPSGVITQSPSGFTVSYSDDGSAYTAAWTVSGLASWAAYQVFSYTNPSYFIHYATTPWGSHAYWRCLLFGSNSAGTSSASETGFAATPGGATQTTGGTASASSSFSGSFLPANAFDGTESTTWVSGSYTSNTPAYLEYAFASSVVVAQMTWITRDDSNFAQGPSSMVVQFSDNGTNWTSAWQVSGLTWAEGVKQSFTDPLWL